MDMTHSSGHDQAAHPINNHHAEEEEEERHESGASKMFKKVKERAKKFKNSLTKHGNEHEEDDENDEQVSEVHNAPVHESSAARGGVTGQPESLSHPGETNVPVTEEIISPGTKVFPEPLRDTSYGQDEPSHPVQMSDTSDRGESREAHHVRTNAPLSLPCAGRGSDYLSGVSNVTNPTKEEGGKTGVPDEISDQKSGPEFEKDFPTRSFEFDQKTESGIYNDSPTRFVGTHDQFSPVLSRPKERDNFDPQAEQTRDEPQEPKPISYTEQIGSATSFVTDKALAAKNAVFSSLGYSGETASETVTENLTQVVDKDKETGSALMTKLPISGVAIGSEETEPGEEDKALSEDITEKLQIGGGEEEKIRSDQKSKETEYDEAVAEEGKGGGIVGKIKGAYNYWLGGTTEEVKQKSPDSVEESSQLLGSTIGTKGFSDSGETGLGETGGGAGAVPVQRGL